MFLGVEAGRAPKPPHPYPHSLEPTWLYRRDAGVGPLLSLPGERGINCLFFARLPSAGEGQPALAGGVRGIAVLQPRKLLGHARGQLAGLTSTTAFRQPGHPPCCPTGSGHDATAAAWGQHGTTSKPATAAIRTARQAPVQIQPPAIQSWACRCERRTTGSRRGTSGGPAASPDYANKWCPDRGVDGPACIGFHDKRVGRSNLGLEPRHSKCRAWVRRRGIANDKQPSPPGSEANPP